MKTDHTKKLTTNRQLGAACRWHVAVLLVSACAFSVSCGGKRADESAAAAAAKARQEEGLNGAAARFNRRKKLPATLFSRGNYSGSIRLAPSGVDAEETAEEKRRALELAARARGGQISADEARALMADARQLETSAILRVAESLMDSADEAVRAEALMLADGATGPTAVPLLWRGLSDASPDIRALAMETAQQLNEPAIQPFVDAGLEDASEAVRQFALQAGTKQEGQMRLDSIVKGLASPHADVAMAALAEAQASPGKNLMPHVIGALGHRSTEVRETAHEMLFLLLGESFSNAAQAGRWWSSNHRLFDDDLVLADLARIQALAAERSAAVNPR